jgi:hypothetical protein
VDDSVEKCLPNRKITFRKTDPHTPFVDDVDGLRSE